MQILLEELATGYSVGDALRYAAQRCECSTETLEKSWQHVFGKGHKPRGADAQKILEDIFL
jgi:hypothetical protein